MDETDEALYTCNRHALIDLLPRSYEQTPLRPRNYNRGFRSLFLSNRKAVACDDERQACSRTKPKSLPIVNDP